ncbi:CTP synthase/UTP-ammonia lyase [Giardia muris]|uniref:CTP synthase n=1 Tax=Giardia muris TaxID=5742 RepID=A0A4Z1T7W5_GIAMU|nr:CTP synthase/UTP-ammonia lyase [Giardia muris]|eukprot:TNJ28669.1 CTP synthase/UTP-ammonia lyase [Giardia muris]
MADAVETTSNRFIFIFSDETNTSKTALSAYIASHLDRMHYPYSYLKLSPTLSLTFGNLTPTSAGEAFITHDGGEVDYDVGIVERSISKVLPRTSNLTLGQAIQALYRQQEEQKDTGYAYLTVERDLLNYLVDYVQTMPPYLYEPREHQTPIRIVEIGGSINNRSARLLFSVIPTILDGSPSGPLPGFTCPKFHRSDMLLLMTTVTPERLSLEAMDIQHLLMPDYLILSNTLKETDVLDDGYRLTALKCDETGHYTTDFEVKELISKWNFAWYLRSREHLPLRTSRRLKTFPDEVLLEETKDVQLAELEDVARNAEIAGVKSEFIMGVSTSLTTAFQHCSSEEPSQTVSVSSIYTDSTAQLSRFIDEVSYEHSSEVHLDVDRTLQSSEEFVARVVTAATTLRCKNEHKLELVPRIIAIVGKFVTREESYLSVLEALRSTFRRRRPGYTFSFMWIDPTVLNEENYCTILQPAHGIILPGGFGNVGVDGLILSIRYARKNNISFLGLCLGMQMAICEFARNECGMKGANSSEMDRETPYPLIHSIQAMVEMEIIKPLQAASANQGTSAKYGYMRLGDLPVHIRPGTIASKLYGGRKVASERHWHSYGANMSLFCRLEEKGLVGSIWDSTDQLVLGIELPEHKFFFATQFHPEFASKHRAPHEIFVGFIESLYK